MPHLSPIMWILMPLLSFLLIMFTLSSFWFSYFLNFPQIFSSNTQTMKKIWKW